MLDFLCHGCNQKRAINQIRECNKCHKVLCDSCRGGASTCKDSKHGTAGCTGQLQQKR